MSPFSRPSLSFTTKVLLPVLAIMAGLVATTMLLLNIRFTQQLEEQASASLETSHAVLSNIHSLTDRQWLNLSKAVPNDPRFKAVAALGEPNTIRFTLLELLDEVDADLLSFHPTDGEPVTVTRDIIRSDRATVERTTDSAARLGIPAASTTRMAALGEQLVRLAVTPVQVGRDTTAVFVAGRCVRDQDAFELQKLTGADVLWFIGERASLSTLPIHEQQDAEAQLAAALGNGPTDVSVGGNRHFAKAQAVRGLDDAMPIRCFLLSSIAPQLKGLRDIQKILLLVGFFGMLLSSLAAWLVIGRLTHPLHELRESADLVGRGDFSRNVQVRSNDEIGDLARTFNMMVHNIQTSQAKLESTVSTLKDTRARLVQTEKLSAIGEFISGIAHELNNPLTVMVGFSQLLKESELEGENRDFVDQIAESGDRCHKIVQNLLSFARQRPPERKPLCINEVVKGTSKFLEYEMRTSNIQVVQQLQNDLPCVDGDQHQVQQVVLNIMNNARQAMEASQGSGSLRVVTSATPETVRLTIEDNGPGIRPEHKEKLFDPFFTTKEPGKGTGLGLSVSYGIIQEHGGEVRVESEVGTGTTFIIDLPVSTSTPTQPADVSPELHTTDVEMAIVGKRVLVVDDEESILELTRNMLGRLRHDVHSAQDGQAALEILKKQSFDLVLCDWKMPGMNGQQLYETLLDTQPETTSRFLFMTGDTLNKQMQSFIEKHGAVLLAKPFSLDEFRASMQEVTLQQPAISA